MRRLNVETPRDLEDLDEIARPRADVERRLDVTRLRSALETLPDSQRRAILLREWRGFSYSEIASELGVTESATETLLFRARKTLARKLEETHAAFVGNVATAGSFLRSLLTGGVAKTAAVGVVAASVAAVPLVRHDVARTTRANSPSPVTVAPSHVVRRTIDHPAVRPAATARATHPRFATHAPQTQAPASTAAVSVTLGASTPDTPKSPSVVSPPAAESNHATTAATRPTVSAPPELPVPVALPATPKIDAGVIAVALPPVTVPVAPVALPTP